MDGFLSSSMRVWEAPYAWLGSAAAGPLIWGLTARLIALVYALHFFSLLPQLRGWCGKDGMNPAHAQLSALWRDYGWKATWYWPSVLYPLRGILAYSDAPLLGLCASAGVASLLVAAGAVPSSLGFAFAWVSMLTIDSTAHILTYPWDSFLFETGFLCLFLPELRSIAVGSLASSLSISAMPFPLLRWSFRWLLVRLLVGFGKLKFMGSTSLDRLYIKYFLISQPIPTQVGLFLFKHVPDWVWVMSLYGMFVIEIPLPLLAFFAPATWGWVRVVVAAAVWSLMAGIQLTGNFGYFNVLTSVLTLPWLHHTDSVFEGPLSANGFVFALLVALYLVPVSVLSFPFNSWMNLGWLHWPTLRKWHPQWLSNSIPQLMRLVSQFRAVQTYGVFPPNAFPPQRWLIKYEALDTNAGDSGKTGCAHSGKGNSGVVAEWAPPHLFAENGARVAPYHPRLDHAFFYEGMGMGAFTLVSLLGHHHPYRIGWGNSDWVRLQSKLAAEAGGPAECLLAGEHTSAVSNSRPALIPGCLWMHHDLVRVPTESGSGKGALVLSQHAAKGALAEWEYVRPWRMIQASLYHRVVAEGVPGAAGSSEMWDEARLSTHLLPLIAYHILRNRKSGAEASILDEDYCALRQDVTVGPEDFAWEYPFWRQRTQLTTTQTTDASYARMWEFIAAVRRAAIQFANQRVLQTSTTDTTVAGGSSGSGAGALKLRFRRANVVVGAPNRSGGIASHPPPRAVPRDAEYLLAPTLAQQRVHVPTPTSTLQQASAVAQAAMSSDATGPWPLWVSDSLLAFDSLPAILASVRHEFPPLQLLDVKHTLNMCTLPILRLCEKVFWPPAESESQLAADLHAATGSSARADNEVCPTDSLYLSTRQMACGRVAAARGTPPAPPTTHSPSHTPHTSTGSAEACPTTFDIRGVTYPITHFASNDDAGLQGCMQSHFRFGCFAQWSMLVGGRGHFERMVGGAATVLNHRLPTSFEGPGGVDAIGASSRLQAFRQLIPDPTLSPDHMPSESSFLLQGVLQYELLHYMANRAVCPALQTRAATTRVPPSYVILPGGLDLNERLAAHPQLTCWDSTTHTLLPAMEKPAWIACKDGSWYLADSEQASKFT